ncbi:hypothetical protein RJ640_010344 [Escallonia rubra]|uniref:Uncharacterized protein n=1 Tax=Escallonia rubra TaxID=112253 RepID=A0AA88UNI5_9ASTE|nr:hypothetical protein RJ640_010344 [Escallonia rubra]
MLKVACVEVKCMVVTAPYAKAVLSCGAVANRVIPCLGYQRTGGSVPLLCCAGVESLARVQLWNKLDAALESRLR